ncbi:Tat pathway signal sequence domain protein [Streptomyces viridochromogenes]|uniref:Tat pathway signal sequence domain protein n=2 Tax=Streptomyces viridochromogenes TaxID=1938 RepID=A0A0J7ZB74_STRVR|nr:Tat pathway signal sequence domain protein [Streptomyces viridochromogenes]KOG17529.1 Tat pathway signal sequence domain protein [Streptomyces viridochromogenes]KOG25727.1 Tat pathway signal sequence domain protein [Streptomyces viridochromogenes]
MLKATGATVGAVGIGVGTTALATPAAAAGASFAHPGLLHTRADLDRMAAKVKAGAEPYTAGFAKLAANPHAQSSWRPRPTATVYRGGGSPQNYAALYKDIHAAYQNALRWHITGESAHADTAVAILNAWSGTLTSLQGSADRFLAAGLYGYQFANAAELVRDRADFEAERFRKMLLDVFCPLSESFLADHNNAVVTNYWTNWDLTAMCCVLATGIHCDDRSKVDRAVEYFKHGEGLGSIRHAIPVVHDDGLAEWLEAGRDQGHALLGVGLMGTFCEMAWNQGIDLYGYDDNRFLKGAQYVAKWALGGDVPFTANTRKKGALNGWSGSESVTEAAPVNPGMTRPIWAMIANHYTKRRGLSASYLTRVAARSAPEGGGGNYGPDSGGYDQLGFGTLAFTRDKATGAGAGTGGSPSPAASASGSAAGTAGAGSEARPQGGAAASPSASASAAASGDLAATGSDDVLGWTAATGVTALAGGLLLLRRRGRVQRESAE